MAKVINPEAELEARETDLPLRDEEFLDISLFDGLKRKPSIDKFPGAIKLRRYRQGEAITRQGEAGWTAFYLLTSEDVAALADKQASLSRDRDKRDWQAIAAEHRQRSSQSQPLERAPVRKVCGVYLSVAPRKRKRQSWFQRWFGGGQIAERQQPESIVIDGPTDINYQSLKADLFEGELFGEQSCLFNTPRSATVVAERDCYVLEMLRNILDQLQKDPAYKARMDEVYRKRVFEIHLRRLSIFSDLTEQQFLRLRDKFELITFEQGQILFDEHDRPDSIYIVRNGLVKEVKKSSALLSQESIRNWDGLCMALKEAQAATPLGKIGALLDETTRALIANYQSGRELPAATQQELLYGINEVIKKKDLADAKELAPILESGEFLARVEDLPPKRKDLSEQDLRRYNRHLLDLAFGRPIREYRKRVGPECVLSYMSKGDYLGEIGLILGESRTSTCVAFGHPQAKEATPLEVVRISSETFQSILRESPQVRKKVEQKAKERHAQSLERAKMKVWEEDNDILTSDKAEKLGLVQGQRLMLIDLDRCTRCDECVRACVNAHDDGYSRLFLDGPRFDRYLVPLSCRSCLDPVCMIGCPVGSIHRGDNGQMIIEDWCIGCGLCAKNCPYGSIQMHDIGIIPEDARGWRYSPEDLVKDASWFSPRAKDHHWLADPGPFSHDAIFQQAIRNYRRAQAKNGDDEFDDVHPILFRYTFNLDSYLMDRDAQFKMEVASGDAEITVWVNGEQVVSEKPKGGKREYWLPPKPAEEPKGKAEAKPAPP
ncbi:MAG: cyclic nucleotide-binding domain-containing protein, partial [Gemmataceae bacterium]